MDDEGELLPVIVTIDDAHVAAIEAVARTLEHEGLRVGRVLSTVGVVAGTAPAAALSRLKALRGVADVELDQEMYAMSKTDSAP